MARLKGLDWKLSDGVRNSEGGITYPNGTAELALLMDIRDELQAVRRILECPRFQRIPGTVLRIATNTQKVRRKRGAA